MKSDYLHHPYASRRFTVFGSRGMVATSHPLAAQAGLDILKLGGNAIDAAVATAAALTVVEPTANGIGGDAFALIWTKGKLYGLNASGPSPKSISIEAVNRAGYSEMPKYGFLPVTVPGEPAGWASMVKRFGNLPLTKTLSPAIDFAENGHPVAPIAAKFWNRAWQHYKKELIGEEFKHWFTTFAQGDHAPEAGEVWRSPDHARTLQAIAETGAASFYQGRLAEEMSAFSRQFGGFLCLEDLAEYEPEWVEPISVNYRGYDVWEIPPNGQGLITLLGLNILKEFDFAERDTIDTYHRQLEAMKLAFADGKSLITDLKHMGVSLESLLAPAYGTERAKLVGDHARLPKPGHPPNGGTVYLATADGEGNMVSFIQSNYMGFGSGLVVPGTGIALQNRGHTFSLDPAHVNHLEPGKRTFHTIIPGFLTKNGTPVGPFGVMGGYMQPQGHLQVVMNTVDFGMNPQAALDAPRWQWTEGNKVSFEWATPEHIVSGLARRGHEVQVAADSAGFGRGQIIWRLPNGTLAGGTESRTDGQVAVW